MFAGMYVCMNMTGHEALKAESRKCMNIHRHEKDFSSPKVCREFSILRTLWFVWFEPMVARMTLWSDFLLLAQAYCTRLPLRKA